MCDSTATNLTNNTTYVHVYRVYPTTEYFVLMTSPSVCQTSTFKKLINKKHQHLNLNKNIQQQQTQNKHHQKSES